MSADDHMMAVPATSGESIELGTPVKLFRVDANPAAVHPFDVSADGRRFLVNAPLSGASSTPIVVLNWAAELRP